MKCYTDLGRVSSVAAVLSFLVLCSGTAYAAAVDGKQTGSGVVSTNHAVRSGESGDGLASTNSTVITADKLTFDYEKGYGDLEDNVHVVSSEMSIDADRIVLKFQENNQITNLVATGSVSIRQGDGFATCSTARCDVATGEVVLTGSPVLRRGQEVMKGTVITIVREPGKKSVRVKCVG
ncbi:MAG: LptA/OstA family protein, partial [bacterium]